MMIKLTAPNGEPVEVNPESISSMFPNDGTYHHDAKTVLNIAGQVQAVKETMDEIDAIKGKA